MRPNLGLLNKRYPGAHSAIVDRETFEAVQQLLAQQAQTRTQRPTRRSQMALTGKLFDAGGAPMTPTFTSGGRGQVYRYSVSVGLQTGRQPGKDNGIRRVPAAAVERLVRETLSAAADVDVAGAYLRGFAGRLG